MGTNMFLPGASYAIWPPEVHGQGSYVSFYTTVMSNMCTALIRPHATNVALSSISQLWHN